MTSARCHPFGRDSSSSCTVSDKRPVSQAASRIRQRLRIDCATSRQYARASSGPSGGKNPTDAPPFTESRNTSTNASISPSNWLASTRVISIMPHPIM